MLSERRSVCRHWLVGGLTAAMLLVTGWGAWARAAEPVPACPDVSGTWTGTWQSCTNGHRGPMTATLCKLNDTCYQMHVRGRFAAILPFSYTTTLSVTECTGNTVRLAGQSHLGLLFGTFSCTAEVTDCHMTANYCSKKDQGTFTLTRCCR